MFEFYFVDEMLGSPAPGWFSKVLPFITLLLGVALGRWFQYYDKRIRDKKTTDDLITEIQLLDEPVARQVKIVNELIVALQTPQLITPKYTSILSLKLDRLAVIDRAGVVDYFARKMPTRKMALEKANQLLIGCEVFTQQHGQLQAIVVEHAERTTKMFEDWRAVSNKLLRLIARMMADVEATDNTPESDAFVLGAIVLMKDFNQFKDVFEVLNKFHTPLAKHNALHRTDPRAQELAELNSQALQVLSAMQREREYTVANVSAARNGMVKQHGKFKELLAGLKFVKH